MHADQHPAEPGIPKLHAKAFLLDLLRRAEEVEEAWRPGAIWAGDGRKAQAVGGAARRERERTIPQVAIVGGAQQDGELRHGGVVNVAHLCSLRTLAEQRPGILGRLEIMGGASFGGLASRAGFVQLLCGRVVSGLSRRKRGGGGASGKGNEARSDKDEPEHDRGNVVSGSRLQSCTWRRSSKSHRLPRMVAYCAPS